MILVVVVVERWWHDPSFSEVGMNQEHLLLPLAPEPGALLVEGDHVHSDEASTRHLVPIVHASQAHSHSKVVEGEATPPDGDGQVAVASRTGHEGPTTNRRKKGRKIWYVSVGSFVLTAITSA